MRLAVIVAILAMAVLAQEPSRPTDFQGWMEKGGLDFRSARYAEAVADFQQATDLNPEDAGARLALAGAYVAQYDPGSAKPENVALAERARIEYGRVLQDEPRNLTALRALGTLSLQEAQALPEAKRLNKLDDARDWFHRVIEADSKAKEAFCSLGLIDWLKFSPAWLEARTRLGLKPEDPGPLTDAGGRQDLLARYGGAIDSAVMNLTEALEIEPDYAEALATISWVMRVRADLDESPARYRADMAQANQWAEKARASQSTKNPERLRVAGEVQAAKLISKVEPVYPPAAQQQRIQGTVQFRAIIDRAGHVSTTQLVSGPELLVATAQEAVRKWVYRPTLFNGQPVEVITYIDVNFSLR